MTSKKSEVGAETRKPHWERDEYNDQTIHYRIADLLEELIYELREQRWDQR